MTVKQKILFSNMMMVCVPILAAFLFGLAYFGEFENDSRNIGKGDLWEIQTVFYTFENGLAHVDWNEAARFHMNSPDTVLSSNTAALKEMIDMGYHLQVISGSDMIFSNMTDSDLSYISNLSSDGSFMMKRGDIAVISDTFTHQQKHYQITAVYNQIQSDAGIRNSLVPLYQISPVTILIFAAVIFISVIFADMILTNSLSYSILEPLMKLKNGADKIRGGDLDTEIVWYQNDEFGSVCSSFNSMREKLKKAETVRILYEKYRGELLIGISHDLRSPLTSIKGYAMGLKDGIADTDEKKTRYYNAILTRTEDLERLISGLSALAGLENGDYQYHMEPVNLHDYLSEFIADETAYAEQNQLEWSYENQAEALQVMIDPGEMRRVLMNLLENAVKHRTADLSVIRIHVGLSEDGGIAEIRFVDNGDGVAHEELEKIFEIFYRTDQSRTKPENGSGLGLAIVKSIIEGHGGTIAAYNDNGLAFLIKLPVTQRS